jgi:hypothetical protein
MTITQRYVPQGYTKLPQPEICKKLNIEVFVSDTGGVPCALAFAGKATKPSFHYRYRSNEAREESIAKWLTHQVDNHKRKQEQREAKKNVSYDVKVGDIFRSSWGYDQTNVDYFQVIEVKNKTLTVREIGAGRTYEQHGDCGRCSPVRDAFIGPTQTKRLQGTTEHPYFRHHSFCTASRVNPNESTYWSSYA